jgi:glutathione S-transferase
VGEPILFGAPYSVYVRIVREAPALAAWLERMGQRASIRATRSPMESS